MKRLHAHLDFANSTRGVHAGVDHLGFQTDDAEALAAMCVRADAAELALLDRAQPPAATADGHAVRVARHVALLRSKPFAMEP